MSTAICLECGRTQPWEARRGARLSALRCKCGGSLRLATFAEGKWAPVARKVTNAGKHYETCEICQRKTLRLHVAPVEFRLRFDSNTRLFPPGTKFCGAHRDALLPADHPYWALLDLPVTPALLKGWINEVEIWAACQRPEDATPEDWEWQRSAPAWLREQLAEAREKDLVSLRNTILDHLLRARNLSVSSPRAGDSTWGALTR